MKRYNLLKEIKDAECYHAGMTAENKQETHNLFVKIKLML